MSDEELKQKCTERAKIFQQAMESCHSSSPMDCIEWFADRIVELEAKYYSVSEIAHHRGMCCISALKENRELEEENAKLKSEKGCESCTKFDEVQLTKAKEILKKFLDAKSIEETCVAESEAEQFLKGGRK